MAEGKRLRCADCQHRWVPRPPDSRDDEDEATPAPPVVIAPPPEPAVAEAVAPDPELVPDLDPEPDPEPRPTFWRNLVAVVLALALGIAAAALWLRPADLAQLPGAGPLLARAAPLPLAITMTGRVTRLPSGERLLEVDGEVRNTGTASVTLPPLRASLAGPAGVARRWTIAPPVVKLAPGASVRFTSTATGVPADTTRLSVTPGR